LAYIVPVRVGWDEAKNIANQRKHGVSFDEAKERFISNVDYLEIFDDAHSEVEDRFIAIGPIARGLVLVVWTSATKIQSASSALVGPQCARRISITPTCLPGGNPHD
jgi:uncharacterized DUF497 family protein